MTSPVAPTGLTVTATGTTSLRAAWTAPATGGAVRNYRVRHRIGGGSYTESVVNSDETSLDITGLVTGTTYQVSVRAENIGGNSPYTAAVVRTTN